MPHLVAPIVIPCSISEAINQLQNAHDFIVEVEAIRNAIGRLVKVEGSL